MKRWLYPTTVERDYLAAIMREVVRPLEQVVREQILSLQVRADALQDIPESSGWFETLRQAFVAALTAASVDPVTVRALVRRYLTRTDQFNRREFDSVLRSVYGPNTPPAAIRAAIQAGRGETEIERAFRDTLVNSGMNQAEIDAAAARVFPRGGQINRAAFREAMRRALSVDVITGDQRIEQALRIAEAENIALIRSIPDQALNRMHTRMVEAVRLGKSLREVREAVVAEFGVTERRAELIARDQIGKLNGELTRIRQEDIGVEEYTWRGVLDARERPEHVAREGRIFKWSEPPADGHPGQPIRCRCTAEPRLPSWEELERSVTGVAVPAGVYS